MNSPSTIPQAPYTKIAPEASEALALRQLPTEPENLPHGGAARESSEARFLRPIISPGGPSPRAPRHTPFSLLRLFLTGYVSELGQATAPMYR